MIAKELYPLRTPSPFCLIKHKTDPLLDEPLHIVLVSLFLLSERQLHVSLELSQAAL